MTKLGPYFQTIALTIGHSVTIYYLEMTTPAAVIKRPLPANVQLSEIKHDQWQYNRFLYQLIGQPWQWFDKLNHTDTQWREYVCREQLRTWVAYVDGAIAGYFELEQQGADIEVQYFGLTEDFIGKGIGSGLLSEALQLAWAWGTPQRVCVNTCTKDHPSAIKNYQARGFEIYKTVED